MELGERRFVVRVVEELRIERRDVV